MEKLSHIETDCLDESSLKALLEYIDAHQITRKRLLELSMRFPIRANKKMIGSGIIVGIAR